jgi:hypothetical protein
MLWLLDMIHNTASGYEVSSSTNLQDYEVSLSIFTCHGSKSHYLLLHLEPMERDHFNLSTRLSPQQGRLVFEKSPSGGSTSCCFQIEFDVSLY